MDSLIWINGGGLFEALRKDCRRVIQIAGLPVCQRDPIRIQQAFVDDPPDHHHVIARRHFAGTLALELSQRLIEQRCAAGARLPGQACQLVCLGGLTKVSRQIHLPLVQHVHGEMPAGHQQGMGLVAGIDAQGEHQGTKRNLHHPGGGEGIADFAVCDTDHVHAGGDAFEQICHGLAHGISAGSRG